MDGQKFAVERPTVKARYSRKYFGRGRGVVAYTLLCNHAPLQGWLIGAHEFEAHYVFDIWYRNTSDIVPTAITGDMHSVNKANFAVLHWFGLRFEPRFTDLEEQLKDLYCADDPALRNVWFGPSARSTGKQSWRRKTTSTRSSPRWASRK